MPKYKKLYNNKKNSSSGLKLPYLGILGCKLKELLSYLKSASPICKVAKFLAKCKVRAKLKILNFSTKHAGFKGF